MLSMVGGVMLAVSAFGADGLAQLTLSVSTPGPDTYADGTEVLAGETYLLVYVKEGATFQGVYTDGALVDPVNNTVATRAHAVEGAKCGFTAIQYPATMFPAGGSWVIVLLDTRRSDGSVGGLVASHGVSAAVGAAAALSTSLNAVEGAAGLSASGDAPSPVGTPVPVITAVRPGLDGVGVQFKNVSDGALYKIMSTTDLADANGWQAVAERVSVRDARNLVQGGSGMELQATVGKGIGVDKVRFFKVVAQ
jgi:hypothetical protein